MTTLVAVLRGINLGGNTKLKMDALRAHCETIGLRDVRSYIQSGNLVFRTSLPDVETLLAAEIGKTFGVRTFAVTRTLAEMRSIVGHNPFPGIAPTKLVVCFLQSKPTAAAVAAVEQMAITPEEVRISGREMYIHFPLGQGVSKLPMARIEKTLGTSGTSRNWNTVLALLAMAEKD